MAQNLSNSAPTFDQTLAQLARSFPTVIPSRGAQNQFFVFGNLIMGKPENEIELKSDLKRTKKEVKVLTRSLEDMQEEHDNLLDTFTDEKTRFDATLKSQSKKMQTLYAKLHESEKMRAKFYE